MHRDTQKILNCQSLKSTKSKLINIWFYQSFKLICMSTLGKSPGWPGSDTKYISKVNMKNIGKRDKISIDDDGDQRILKLKKEKWERNRFKDLKHLICF